MNRDDTVLGILIYAAIIVSLAEETRAKYEYYSLTTNQKETEEKVFSYLHEQKTMLGWSKLHSKNSI